jgi:hypothetical protein
VVGADVSLSVLSRHYWEGTRVFSSGPPAFWATPHVPAVGCPDEDVNHNGVLDAGEDLNANNKIEAGNILTVVPETGTAGTATTDKNGFALFDVFYPQAYAYWLEVALTAKLTVQGTEFSETTVFVSRMARQRLHEPNQHSAGRGQSVRQRPKLRDAAASGRSVTTARTESATTKAGFVPAFSFFGRLRAREHNR